MGDDRVEQLIKQVRKLTLQVQELERSIESKTDSVSTTTSINFSAFATGDRVRILNSVKKPAKWDNAKEWHNDKARHSTVTRIQGGRVYIVTDNGVSTWRSANNLRCTSNDE
jgi:cell division septum initiation protein DivIVA